MKKVQLAMLLIALLLIGACSSDKAEKTEEQEKTEETVGFSLTGDSIEEAENIPEEEKERILQAFDTYISTFNEKDLDAYMETIAEETESFDKKEEREYTESVFNDYDLIREPSDITIVKYSENEAQVFAQIKYSLKQLSTGLETTERARQVTVFTKENDDWKVKSIHSIGENPIKE